MVMQISSVGAMFTFLVPVMIVYSLSRGYHINPADAAATINIVLVLARILRQLVAMSTAFATKVIALDRCFEYADLPPENDSAAVSDCEPTGIWPNQGKIEFKNFSVRYSEDSDLALKDISLTI